MPSFLQPDIQQIISQAISFLLLLWVLKRFAWRPLLNTLDQRRARIEHELSEAAKARSETAKLQEDLTRRLAKIDDEARTKIQRAILDAKKVSLEVQEQARVQARTILAKSKETVEIELAKSRVILRDQVADMTLEAVERVLQQKLDTDADRKLIDATLDELERNASRNET